MSKQSKKCSICQIEKPISEFVKDKYSSDGHVYRCKECKKIYNKLNKDRIKETRDLYYIDNREEIINKQKLYTNSRKC